MALRWSCWHDHPAPVLSVPGVSNIWSLYGAEVGKTIPAEKIADLDKKAQKLTSVDLSTLKWIQMALF